MTPAEIQKLQALAEQGKLRDLAVYSGLLQKHETIRREISELQATAKGGSDGADITVVARWLRWVEGELHRLEGLALIAKTDREAARNVAIKSAAKVHALEYLLKDAKKSDLMLRRRRAEQNGLPPDA